MKRKLLFPLFLITTAAFAQQPISHFQGISPVSGNQDGMTLRYYFRGIPAVPVDQSPMGANVSWDFSGVNFILDHHDYANSVPDAQVIADYPTCNFRTDITQDIPEETATIYASDVDGAFSILRADGEIMTLDYTINTAFMGQFPMDYGYVSSDVVAGNFIYYGELGNFTGTFSGTVDSSFDGYGTLEYKSDSGPISSTDVSRLKVTQTISLSVPFLPDAGTLTQTSYYYFAESQFGIWPFVRSIQTHLTVPVLDIDESLLILEKATDAVLGTQNPGLASLSVYPNPASDRLTVRSQMPVRSMELFSADGKTIAKSATNAIDVSNLNNGIYLVSIKTDAGSAVKKFIKI